MKMKLIVFWCFVEMVFCIPPAQGQDKVITFRQETLSAAEYLKELTEKNWIVDEQSSELIGRFATKEALLGRRGEEITLEIVTPRDLGFTKGAAYDQICTRAATRNLQLCNPLDVVEFCKSYDRYTITGQSLIIATKPARCSDGQEYVFLCKCRNQRQRVIIGFQAGSGADHHTFLPSAKFVFERKPA
jgi:hypothetical protein